MVNGHNGVAGPVVSLYVVLMKDRTAQVRAQTLPLRGLETIARDIAKRSRGVSICFVLVRCSSFYEIPSIFVFQFLSTLNFEVYQPKTVLKPTALILQGCHYLMDSDKFCIIV